MHVAFEKILGILPAWNIPQSDIESHGHRWANRKSFLVGNVSTAINCILQLLFLTFPCRISELTLLRRCFEKVMGWHFCGKCCEAVGKRFQNCRQNNNPVIYPTSPIYPKSHVTSIVVTITVIIMYCMLFLFLHVNYMLLCAIVCQIILSYVVIWVCLKIGYIPNYSHLIGIMIINHWVQGYTIFRHTHKL